MRRLHIAFVIDTMEPFYRGGYERYAWEIARRLAKQHDVWAFTSCSRDQVVEGVRFVSLCPQRGSFGTNGYRRPSSILRYIVGLLYQFRNGRHFDIVDCNATPFLHVPIVARLARFWGAKMVLTAHEALAHDLATYASERIAISRLRKPIAALLSAVYRNAMGSAATIVCPSRLVAGDLEREGGRAVLPVLGGVDRVHTAKNEFHGRITFVGRLVVTKRVEMLIRAIAIARAEGVVLALSVVGDGPQLAELVELARTLGCTDCVTFWGQVADQERTRILVQETDAYASASLREGISLATLEAMAAGNPAIISQGSGTLRNGAMEYVMPGLNGYVADGSAESIARAMADLASLSPQQYEFLSRAAIDAAEEYTWNGATARTEEIMCHLAELEQE